MHWPGWHCAVRAIFEVSHMRRPRLGPTLALTTALTVLALASCGGSEMQKPARLQPIELTLDFRPTADHAGIFMAKKLGYFEQEGLELSIHTPITPQKPIEYIADGAVDLAISHEPELLAARARGREQVAVYALVPRPLTSLIWLKRSKIKGIAGLRGKTIATTGLRYQRALLKAILSRAGLTLADVHTIDVGYNAVPALLNGRAAAAFGYWNLAGEELRLRGEHPVVTPVADLGVPPYDELVVIARKKRLEQDPASIRRFLNAVARGTAAAAARPAVATKALLEAEPQLNPKLTAAQVRATLPLLSRQGSMDPSAWRRFSSWMHAEGLISAQRATGEAVSDAYLPSTEN